jgi:hypothetical protein
VKSAKEQPAPAEANDARRDAIVIVMRATIEESDEPEPVLATMRLTRDAAEEYAIAIEAMRSVVLMQKLIHLRALEHHSLTAAQRDESAIPWPFYVGERRTEDHPAFWEAIETVREADDYCAIGLRAADCPRDEELAECVEPVEIDGALMMQIHALGINWTGRTVEPESDLTIGDLPRHLVGDFAAGRIQYGIEYWEHE